MENNTLGNIYCLKNPTTNEIFYVGATIKTLEKKEKLKIINRKVYR